MLGRCLSVHSSEIVVNSHVQNPYLWRLDRFCRTHLPVLGDNFFCLFIKGTLSIFLNIYTQTKSVFVVVEK